MVASTPEKPFEIPIPIVTKAVILVYHDFVKRRGPGTLWFDCTPSELRQQIRALRQKGAVFVELDSVVRALRDRKPMSNTVAITAADNYRGFWTHAAPIFREEGIPVTMFVHTGHVGSNKGRPKMTWAELRQLESEGWFRAESQTVSHPPDITRLTPEAARREFTASKETLSKEMGRPIRYLAYPSGKHNQTLAELAQEVGYQAAFTEAQQPVDKAKNFYQIPRYVHTRWQDAWTDLQKDAFATKRNDTSD